MGESNLIYFLVAISGIVIGYFLTQWYHKIPARIRNQKAQLYLLSKIAEKHGVEQQDIINAIDYSNGHDSLEGKI